MARIAGIARAAARWRQSARRRRQSGQARVARAARLRRSRGGRPARRGVRADPGRSPPGCEPAALLRVAHGRSGYVRAAEARAQIRATPLPRGIQDELRAFWREVGARSPWGLAVQSSATCEDGALVSMAGLADSVLGVRGEDALADAVRDVWASLASGRALAYLAAHGVRDVGMAVVIQRMVQATAAGVMFTRAPGVRGPPGEQERIINAGLGLGAPVVNEQYVILPRRRTT